MQESDIQAYLAAGHLRAQGLNVKRASLRAALHRIDPDGVVERRQSRLRHRVYDTPSPNYVWHILFFIILQLK